MGYAYARARAHLLSTRARSARRGGKLIFSRASRGDAFANARPAIRPGIETLVARFAEIILHESWRLIIRGITASRERVP